MKLWLDKKTLEVGLAELGIVPVDPDEQLYLYVMGRLSGPIKIGTTCNVAQRLVQHASERGAGAVGYLHRALLFSRDDARTVERASKAVRRDAAILSGWPGGQYRKRTDWFDLRSKSACKAVAEAIELAGITPLADPAFEPINLTGRAPRLRSACASPPPSA